MTVTVPLCYAGKPKEIDGAMTDSQQPYENRNASAKATQILHKVALEERFKDHTPKPTDPDYADYLTYQALKMVEEQRLKRLDQNR